MFPFACESLAATRLEFLVHDHLSVGTIVFHNAVGESVDHLLVFPDDNLELVACVVESLSVESEHALVVRDVELWCRHPVVRLALVGIDRVRSCGIVCSIVIAQREVPWSVVGIKFECSHFSGRSIVVAFIEEDLSKCRWPVVEVFVEDSIVITGDFAHVWTLVSERDSFVGIVACDVGYCAGVDADTICATFVEVLVVQWIYEELVGSDECIHVGEQLFCVVFVLEIQVSLRSVVRVFAKRKIGVKCSYDRVWSEVDESHRSTISRRDAGHFDRCFFATCVTHCDFFVLLFRVACDLNHARRDYHAIASVGLECDCTTEVDFDHLSLTCLEVNLIGSLDFVAFRVVDSHWRSIAHYFHVAVECDLHSLKCRELLAESRCDSVVAEEVDLLREFGESLREFYHVRFALWVWEWNETLAIVAHSPHCTCVLIACRTYEVDVVDLLEDLVEWVPIAAYAAVPFAHRRAVRGACVYDTAVAHYVAHHAGIFCSVVECEDVVFDVEDVCGFVLVAIFWAVYRLHHVSATGSPLAVVRKHEAINVVHAFHFWSEVCAIEFVADRLPCLRSDVVDEIHHIVRVAVRNATCNLLAVGCDAHEACLVLRETAHVFKRVECLNDSRSAFEIPKHRDFAEVWVVAHCADSPLAVRSHRVDITIIPRESTWRFRHREFFPFSSVDVVDGRSIAIVADYQLTIVCDVGRCSTVDSAIEFFFCEEFDDFVIAEIDQFWIKIPKRIGLVRAKCHAPLSVVGNVLEDGAVIEVENVEFRCCSLSKCRRNAQNHANNHQWDC